MAIEVTDEVANKVARFAELLKWVKEPVNQTVNTIANEEEPKSSMYPELHKHVAKNLEEDGLEYTFRQNDQKVNIKQVHDTKVIGRFICRNRNCGFHRWFSNSIAIRIREYQGNEYNVKVYQQQCGRCKRHTRAELMELAYADRVAFHIKRWNGVDAEPPNIKVEPQSNHKKELCEGCKKGHCGDNREKKKKKKTVPIESENA
ncbi:hypothetical protein FAGAP_8160 [Fusarium agapanthi]|uniref:3CxxC-type domain-containing protein n=1 Tax=Fusarium agapanthi TaxID=1803897 RepID=A0A9P5E574_9HYPO|nr:hypothetical protein FAGAP_8160 [Fusarium agapanthi]